MTKEDILEMLKRVQASGISNTPTETLKDYGLDGFDCEKCGNTGTITRQENGMLYSSECDCMKIRRSMRRIRNSGMTDMLVRYTFDNFEETNGIKERAKQFVDDDGWLYIAGRSGSGKTHICTAICSEIIKRGIEVYYMSWRDESVNLKASVNDAEYYDKHMRKLKTVSVLYIDDFLKAGDSDADIRLAFEILNARYNDRKLRTIISSERELESLFDRDEALAGRIYERAKKYNLRSPQRNRRMS
jgi:DNA replication protein DnaC